MQNTKSRRQRHLARIHILASELGLTEPAYRNTLQALTGHRTAADLDETGRLKIIGFLTTEVAKRKVEPVEIVTDEEAEAILGLIA